MPKVTRLTLDQGGGLERRRLHLREISDDADAPLENVGQDLRKARLRKGEDLARISGILKIRKAYLEALEESNFNAIPGRAYTIGFVRTYADYLGLDGKECVERLKAEIAGRGDNREGAVQVSSPRERLMPPGGFIFAAVLLIAVIYGGYYLVSANRMTAPGVTPVPPRLTAQAGLDRATPAQDPAAASPILAGSANTGPLPDGQRYGAQNSARVTLVAHKPTKVLVQGPNNTTLFNQLLQPGDTYLVPGTVAGVTLSTQDGGAVELMLDGKSMGYAGKDGAVSEGLSLTPQDVMRRQSKG